MSSVWGIFDAAGNRVGGDFISRSAALGAIPPSERDQYKALEVAAPRTIEEVRAHARAWMEKQDPSKNLPMKDYP